MYSESSDLTPKQIDKLTVLLRPFMRTERERRANLFGTFGNHPIRNSIDWTGTSDDFILNLIQNLEDFGTVQLESESKLATVFLLEYVKKKSGENIKKDIDRFIREISSPPPPENGSKLLDLYSFSVQIISLNDNIVMGTGIIVRGKIVTTTQVVRSAGIDPRKAGDAEVRVRLPRTSPGIERTRRAKVAACFKECDDDIVVLELTSDLPSSLNPSSIGDAGKSISSANESCGNPFRSYVFTGDKNIPDDYIDGEIIGQTESPEEQNLHRNLVKLDLRKMQSSPHRAMRGAGVLDKERNLIIGLISTIEKSNNANRTTAVDTYLLYYQPISNVLNINNGVEL